MKDWKLITGVVGGSILMVLIMIYGLTKMSQGGVLPTVDVKILVDGARFIKENGETKVTVVDFSDMECPGCKVANAKIKALRDTPGVKLVFRHFPLKIHTNSIRAAEAVETARIMGKGWEMIDLLFDKQDEWATETKVDEKLVSYAVSLGLNEAEFKQKIGSGEVKSDVQLDAGLASQLQLAGTPTIFVNGEQVATDFVMDKVNELLKY